MPPIICLIGRPNSGKTTLLEKLIPVLKNHGLRIGTVKHHAHAFEMDRPGKDSWRHKQAGATVAALSSPSGLGVIRDVDHDTPLTELVSACFMGVDLVLAEGYKHEALPKIEVHRTAVQAAPLADPDGTWIAYVSDAMLATDLPVFAFQQVEELAAFIMARFLLPCNS
ncbi:MAG: molybdopterin-guanine dinucleotide biosynthesis protein B [Deltaproteobacteria bacterium CG_4_10_14_3_um_filter_60_8]|nr:MAG: molybdopterin-guanine dinucleotide biosynthesis protein B [Desulfobacterales bacterium CG2_30_60_27]PIY21070.1 MAG: molybdopterin-guanine dinucleotide biosynthesis protein B [Deltaproteobacteria bacterium CG_4_10_14_3_um_filter_60_8]